MDRLPRGGRCALRAVCRRRAAEGQRAAHESDRPVAGDRDPGRSPPSSSTVSAALASARPWLRALLARRPLHLQLPAPARRRGPVPVVGRRVVCRDVSGDDGGAVAARAAPQRWPRSQRHDRRPDPHRGSLVAGLDRADGALPAPGRHVGSRAVRVGCVSTRRRDPDRGSDSAGARRRSPRARVLSAHVEHRCAAGHGLRVRTADPSRRLSPSAVARRRLDRLLPALGRRRSASVDGAPRPARTRSRGGAHAPSARAVDVRVAVGSADRDRPRSPHRRSRLPRHPSRLDHTLRARRRANGGARAPTGTFARARAPTQPRRSRARRRHRPRRDRPRGRDSRERTHRRRRCGRAVPSR